MPQANPAAARLTKAMRDAMKHQGLSVSDLADVIGRQTGVRCDPQWVYKVTGDYDYPVLIRVSPHLATLARALNLDPVQLVVDAVGPELDSPADSEHADHGTDGVHGVRPQ